MDCVAGGGTAFDTPRDRVMASIARTEQDPVVPKDEGDFRAQNCFSASASAKVLTVTGAGAISPFSGATWEEVMRHMVCL